jgi:predicted nucleic acid-binding protein
VIAVDANILIYAHVRSFAQHPAARSWLSVVKVERDADDHDERGAALLGQFGATSAPR